MKISKETKIGFVIVLSVLLLIWGLNFLKGKNIFSSEQTYTAIYKRISSLVEGNPVYVNGFKVGQVKRVYFHPNNSGKIVVLFTVAAGTVPLPFDTEAMIYSADLLGSKAIELVLGKDTAIYLLPGDTLLSSVELELADQVNQQIAPLKRKTEELMASIDSAVGIVQNILNNEVMEHVGKGFESFQRSFKKFENIATNMDDLVEANKGKLNDIFSKVQSITTNFNSNNEELTNVIKNLSAISDSVAKADFATTLNNVNDALNATSEIMMKINDGDGTLGLLLNNDKLYNELTMAAIDLNMLLLDMRLNPGKYVPLKRRGKKKEMKRDSIYYENMMEINDQIIDKISNEALQKDSIE
ncbi:MAG: MCE family protein [Flavobacteriales bacterium]|nr:MCE family protein [Flavobacteriales bacterium]